MLDKYNPNYEEIKAVEPLNLSDQRGVPPSSAGDYDITQCPAYIPVAHGNQEGQLAETSLIRPASTTATKDSSEISTGLDKNQDGNLDNIEDNETYWNVAIRTD
jgi:hypothetical protein